MKKALIIVILLVLILSCVACAKDYTIPDNYGWTPPGYTSGTIVENLNGINMFFEGIINLYEAEDVYWQFTTTGGADVANLGSQIRLEIRKKNGGEFYRQEVCFGDLAAEIAKMERYYHNGSESYFIVNQNFSKSQDDVFNPDFSNTEYNKIDKAEGDELLESYKNLEYFVYNEDTVVNSTDVYLYEDKYYSIITIEAIDFDQTIIVEKILSNLNAIELSWVENPTFVVEFTKIDESFYITGYKLTEIYIGKKKFGGITISPKVVQYIMGTIEYNVENSIIKADEKNK